MIMDMAKKNTGKTEVVRGHVRLLDVDFARTIHSVRLDYRCHMLKKLIKMLVT